MKNSFQQSQHLEQSEALLLSDEKTQPQQPQQFEHEQPALPEPAPKKLSPLKRLGLVVLGCLLMFSGYISVIPVVDFIAKSPSFAFDIDQDSFVYKCLAPRSIAQLSFPMSRNLHHAQSGHSLGAYEPSHLQTGYLSAFGPQFEDFPSPQSLFGHHDNDHHHVFLEGHPHHRRPHHECPRMRKGRQNRRTYKLLNWLAEVKDTRYTNQGFAAPYTIVMDLACPVNGVEDLEAFKITPLLSSEEIDKSIYSQVKGKIAVVPRGGCSFYYKTLLMQQHGALAVVVAETRPEKNRDRDLVFMIHSGTTMSNDLAKIPSVFVNRQTYDMLKIRAVMNAVNNAARKGGDKGKLESVLVIKNGGYSLVSPVLVGSSVALFIFSFSAIFTRLVVNMVRAKRQRSAENAIEAQPLTVSETRPVTLDEKA